MILYGDGDFIFLKDIPEHVVLLKPVIKFLPKVNDLNSSEKV
jgi:hypothetical protein